MRRRSSAILFAGSVLAATLVHAQAPASCSASPSSMTPATWTAPAAPAPRAVSSANTPLTVVADVPLPGPAKRFDYQSFDSTTGRLYISHMRGDRLVVFDTRAQKLVASNDG